MALEFGFYNSYDHDRMYSADNMNDIFEGVITDGVYAGVGNEFRVRPSIGLQVTVDTGRAWFKSTWNKNRTITPVNLDSPDPVYPRIDTLCIRVQKNILERRNDFFVYKGAILTNPQPPILQNTDETFYLPLANITVRPNAEEILISDIEILVGRSRCPYVTSILQQTDISDLFAQWQGQFEEWWDGIKDILTRLEEGDVIGILTSIENKVDKADKATQEDITLNSDSKWMTPAKTKSMIDSVVKDIPTLPSSIVTSFKNRTGAVTPASGDYTAAQVGALATSGGTLTGALTIGSTSSNKNLTVNGNGTITGTLGVTGNTTLSGSLGVTSTATFNGSVEMKSSVRLKGSSNYGSVLNWGDGDNVHISEPSDDNMEIKAKSVNIVLTSESSKTGANCTKFTLNGVNPFAGTSGFNTNLITSTTIRFNPTASGSGYEGSQASSYYSIESNIKFIYAAIKGGVSNDIIYSTLIPRDFLGGSTMCSIVERDFIISQYSPVTYERLTCYLRGSGTKVCFDIYYYSSVASSTVLYTCYLYGLY